jgi:hypothetical protein
MYHIFDNLSNLIDIERSAPGLRHKQGANLGGRII